MIGEFHDQDAVLGHHANKQHKTDLTIDVEARSGDQQRDDGAGKAERHCRHDDD
ncbi:hypothetical protein D3C72_2164570 [compost metagenome]